MILVSYNDIGCNYICVAVTLERGRLKNHKADLMAAIGVDTKNKFQQACMGELYDYYHYMYNWNTKNRTRHDHDYSYLLFSFTYYGIAVRR